MSKSMRMWVEISFNIGYLIVVWGLVATMWLRRSQVPAGSRRAANLVIAMFGLLALGDTGHVGFRVVAYALGDLSAPLRLGGQSFGLVGLGALSTAITVTFFYMLAVYLWQARFQQPLGACAYFLLAAGVVRLGLMALPANQWSSVVPPQPWSTIRNLPLVMQGLGVAYLILRSARRTADRTFQWVGVSILVSYACYAPVILFVQQAPLIGMLMIPKTLAYVAIGFLAYRDLYRQPALVRRRARSWPRPAKRPYIPAGAGFPRAGRQDGNLDPFKTIFFQEEMKHHGSL